MSSLSPALKDPSPRSQKLHFRHKLEFPSAFIMGIRPSISTTIGRYFWPSSRRPEALWQVLQVKLLGPWLTCSALIFTDIRSSTEAVLFQKRSADMVCALSIFISYGRFSPSASRTIVSLAAYLLLIVATCMLLIFRSFYASNLMKYIISGQNLVFLKYVPVPQWPRWPATCRQSFMSVTRLSCLINKKEWYSWNVKTVCRKSLIWGRLL